MPTGADPQQQMMRRLFMVMPFIFVFFVIRFPVGLMIYWISTNLWTVGQQATLRKVMGPPPNAAAAQGQAAALVADPQADAAARDCRAPGARGGSADGAASCARSRPRARATMWPRRGRRRCEALRELAGALAEDDVEFVTVSEGERGLMGVGRQPARVLARAQVAAVALGPVGERVRDVVERIAAAIDPELSVTVAEHGTRVIAVASGGDTARLIGRHGQTIDAVQHLAAAAALPGSDGEWEIVVDTAGYRARRERRLRALALKAAERARARRARRRRWSRCPAPSGASCTPCWSSTTAVETASEGRDPARFVVVRPRSEPSRGLFHVTQRPRVSRETAVRGRARRCISAAAPELAPARSRPARAARRAGCARRPVGVTAIRDPAEAAARHVRRGARRPAGGRCGAPPGRSRTSAAVAACRASCSRSCARRAESHLIEATARKAAFIAEVAAELGLRGRRCTPSARRISPAGALRDCLRLRRRRALAPPPVAAELCLPLCRPGGRVVLWSREAAGDELAFAAAALGGGWSPPSAPACS